jgi:hypothetical protein
VVGNALFTAARVGIERVADGFAAERAAVGRCAEVEVGAGGEVAWCRSRPIADKERILDHRRH